MPGDFRNTLYYGDNLKVLREHVADESVDLVYLDPPFNSNADYNVLFAEHGEQSHAQIRAFGDTWRWDTEAAANFEDALTSGVGKVPDAMDGLKRLLGTHDGLSVDDGPAPRRAAPRAQAHRPEASTIVLNVVARGSDIMPEINFDEYWRLRMDAASRKLEAAREIISHPGTRGSLAEHFLRDLIRDFIPQRYGIGTGFVVRKGGPSSLQIDVLVYDQLSSSPLYKDGELVVLTAGSAKVAIEVKSQLNSDEIPRAYTNIASVKSIDPEVTGIVFGYDGVQADKFAEHVGNWAAEAQVPRSRWPDGVYHLGGAYFAIADPAPEDGRLTDEAQFKVRKGVDPVVWLFLTAVLSRLNLTNIEEYMPAGRFEEEVLASL